MHALHIYSDLTVMQINVEYNISYIYHSMQVLRAKHFCHQYSQESASLL